VIERSFNTGFFVLRWFFLQLGWSESIPLSCLFLINVVRERNLLIVIE